MLAMPLSKLNLSCSCIECNTFLRPLPKNPPPIQLPPDLLQSTLGLGFSLPPTPAATPIPSLKGTPHTTPHLRPTAPTLAPSPAFLLTRSHSQTRTKERGSPLTHPSLSLSPLPTLSLTPERVALASRSLWAHISSPISECATPLSAKTPGLAVCAQAQCFGKVVPGFGRTVCGACEAELRGAVLGLGCVMADDLSRHQNQKEECRVKLNKADSGVVLETAAPASQAELPVADEPVRRKEIDAELELFAVPSTPLSTKLLITHSRTQSLISSLRQEVGEVASTLFALPNTSLDKSFEEFTPTTPTTKYAQEFPALPLNSGPENSKGASVRTSKRSSKDVEGLARSLSKNGRKKEGQTGSKIATKRNTG